MNEARPRQTHIFSIPVSAISLLETLQFIAQYIHKKKKAIILPLNLHILTHAIFNNQQEWYKTASVVFADGVPIQWLCWLDRSPLPSRVSGTDLVEQLLRTNNKIFLLGGTPAVLQLMTQKFNTKTQKPIVGAYAPSYSNDWNTSETTHIRALICKSRADIVLVGVGYPKQELWIIQNAPYVSAKIFIAVGSAFDILSGTTPRSPQWIKNIGLEWLWRILLEPKRLAPRYARDVLLFTKLIIMRQKTTALLTTLLLSLLIFWPKPQPTQYRGDAQRTGNYTQNILFSSPSWWRYKTDGLLTGAPVIAGGVVYASGWESSTLFALNEKTGSLIWKFVAQADLPFSPTIYRGIAYIGGVDGHLYALNAKTGKLLWKFQTIDRKSITSYPYISDNNVVIASRDRNIYAINQKSGKESWRFTTGAMNESSPIEYNGLLYFGSFDGKLYAISASDGRKQWEYQTNGPILSSPAISKNRLVIGSEDEHVYTFNLDTHALIWKTQLNGVINATPALSNSSIFIPTLHNKLYSLNIKTGGIIWEKNIQTGSHAGFAIDNHNAYIGSADGSVYALNQKSGSTIWKYTSSTPITSAPSIIGNTIFFTSGWYVYAINKQLGTSYINPSTFSVRAKPKTTDQFEPTEFSISHADSIYENPWNEASVSATFTSQEGRIVNVDGFYYDKDEWRIRVSLPDTGKWSWTIYVKPTPSTFSETSGSIVINPSNNPGFLHISKSNAFQFVLDNGKPFYPVGIGDTILDRDGNNYPLDEFNAGENKKNIHISEYAKIYGKDRAGFNLFRWSIDNAAFPMWKTTHNYKSGASSLWETYPVRSGLWGDELVQTLRKNGFHIWLALWGFDPNVGLKNDAGYIKNNLQNLETYIRYMVARYSAYVDIWELSNETVVTDEWIKSVTAIIRRLDPYQHPITVNYERPDMKEIDFATPHWYETEPLEQSDLATIHEIEKYTAWNKPVLFGEQGNQFANWDDQSGARMRVRLWTAFFNNASLVFWNSSGTKNYKHQKNANLYIGEDERRYIKTFQQLTHNFKSGRVQATLSIHTPGIRYYTSRNETIDVIYLFHFRDPKNNISAQFSLYSESSKTIQYVNPENGTIINTDTLTSGWNTLSTPEFACDLIIMTQ